MVPVAEPETYAMMLAGLGILGFLTRRSKQS
ncbi:MAG: PEP-CTERM sorting domain-containing protein [Janthinobacterium svalbardensis]